MAMPSRLVSLAILVYWCVAAFCLLTWEILPELSLGYPPDLRAIAQAGDASRPVTWDIQVMDDPVARAGPVGRRGGDLVEAAARRLVRADAAGSTSTPASCSGGRRSAARAHVELEIGASTGSTPRATSESFDMKVRTRDSRRAVQGQGQAEGGHDGGRPRARCRS